MPGAAQEGVGAFAEPFRQRMVLPIDDPPDRLYGLIVHELTHHFEFDIIPQSLIRRSVPLWVNEGLSDYERGAVDAARPDDGPRRGGRRHRAEDERARRLRQRQQPAPDLQPRARGVRVHRGEVRQGRHPRSSCSRCARASSAAARTPTKKRFEMKPDEFDQAFERYLKERFKPFRDKERPADYGRDLAPNAEKTALRRGALDRAVALRRPDRGGHRQPQGPRARHRPALVEGRLDRPQPHRAASTRTTASTTSCSWASTGSTDAVDGVVAEGRSARLLRAHREGAHADRPERADPEDRGAHPDEVGGRARVAELLARRPDDRVRGAARRRSATSSPSISRRRQVVNLTDDDFADYGADLLARRQVHRSTTRASAATRSCSGSTSTPRRRRRSPSARTTRPRRSSSTTTRIVFSSTATDPAVPLEPEVAKNGNIYNIWTLDLNTGELRQYTDALGGNLSPIVLNEGKTSRIAFVSYYKGEYSIHTLERKEPLHTAATRRLRRARADHRLPGAAAAHAGHGQRSARRARSRRCSSRAGRR